MVDECGEDTIVIPASQVQDTQDTVLVKIIIVPVGGRGRFRVVCFSSATGSPLSTVYNQRKVIKTSKFRD